VLFLSENIDLDQVNVLDMNAKKVLETLAELNQDEYATGEQLQQKTCLSPEILNEAVLFLEKSLMVDNPSISQSLPPYAFVAVQINNFGRQVLEKYS
jgi:hypothetical protein